MRALLIFEDEWMSEIQVIHTFPKRNIFVLVLGPTLTMSVLHMVSLVDSKISSQSKE